MSAQLSSQPAEVFARRQAKLGATLGATAAVVFSGGDRPRNYPANVYTYRADSHFLYLVGASIPDAALWVCGDQAELFMVPEADDDALWHGALPSFEEIRLATGVTAVRPYAELAEVVAKAGAATVATLPSADAHTRYRQCALLERTWPGDGAPSVTALNETDLVLADAMVALRTIHDDAAVAMMKRALEATHQAHLAGMAATQPGTFEHAVRGAMEGRVLAEGMVPAYGSIITVHGEVLHNTTYHRQLGEHDLVLADLGAEHEGWASDITRTWPVSGIFSPTQRALYEIVLQSQLDAIDKVRPGVRYRDVHLAASLTLARGLVDEGILRGDPEGLVERGAHALLFPHGVGHLIGLDVHDMEDLGDRAGYAPGRTRSEQFGLGYLRLDRDLEPGMAVTIEPGIYKVPAILANEALCGPFVADKTLDRDRLATFDDVRGIRIEDDVLCTPTDPLVLSAAIPKTVPDVEAAVAAGR